MSSVSAEESMRAAKQCFPAIDSIRGIRDRTSKPCRQITVLPTKDFSGAASLNNGSFSLLAKEAGEIPIRVITEIHEGLVLVVAATSEAEANREIESLFLMDAYEAAGIKVPKKLREKAMKELDQKKRH